MLKTILLVLVIVLQSTVAIAQSTQPVAARTQTFDDQIHGTATWYRYHLGQAAAGPALRQALGKHWRGSRVLVCPARGGACVAVRLTDWCACSDDRVIDLDFRDFGRLANPRLGVIDVTVVALPKHLPQTDTDH